MPPNQNNNVNLAAQQQPQTAQQQQATSQQPNQANPQNQQQSNSQNPRMQQAQQPPQQSQQGGNSNSNNSQAAQTSSGPGPNPQQQQQSQQNTQFQQMSVQQQASGPQPQGIPSVPVTGSQPNHIPGQFAGYGSADQHNTNAAPFIYQTHQRMNLPQQSQQGNPQAAAQAPNYGNYMYPQQYGQYHYIDPMVAQQYITQGGGYAPQVYHYAQNPAAVNMYNRG